MSGYLYFHNNLRHKGPYIGLYDNLQNLFPINGNSFKRKPKLIATPYILQQCYVYTWNSIYFRTNCRKQVWSVVRD